MKCVSKRVILRRIVLGFAFEGYIALDEYIGLFEGLDDVFVPI
jgi:hypothetical protein